jgi:hypothetical protein
MASALEQAGAVREPSEYAALNMERYITGIWTQRSPLRDAAVPYLYEKFYSAGRSDSIIDGLNCEVSAKLTLIRRYGHSVYNSNTFPAANSMFPWKFIQNAQEQVRVVYDGKDGVIYDATAGQKSTLFTKSAGAGPARFLGVNTELFISDGVDLKKVLRSAKIWQANTVYTIGDFIIDSNGNIQSFQSKATSLTITNLQIVQQTIGGFGQRFLIVTLNAPVPPIPSNQPVTLSGITAAGYTSFNGTTGPYQAIPLGWNLNLTTSQLAFVTATAVTASAASTGTLATFTQQDANGNPLTGVTGATQPTWATGQGAITQDGTVTWMCFGSPVQNWGLTSPTVPISQFGTLQTEAAWRALENFGGSTLNGNIIDANGAREVTASTGFTGTVEPIWNTALGGITQDGQPSTGLQWMNVGQALAWYASFQYITPFVAIVDTNNNLQVAPVPSSSPTGATQPTWNTTFLGTTTDGSLTWTNYGSAAQLTGGTLQYSYSYHSIDGSVTTAAPVAYVLNPIVGQPGMFAVSLTVPHSTDTQVDKIYLWRTAAGQATLIFLDQIPNWGAHTNFNYIDILPDTSVNGGQALNPFIPAPIADAGDPPPAGLTAMVYHLNRVWGIVANMVVYSGGPDTITGNGNTAWPPLNFIAYIAQPIFLVPITVQNGGILVYTTDGIYIILGTGTASNPFYTTSYYPSVSVTGYTAFDVYNNSVFVMESNGKVSTQAVEYPFNPQTGYTEVGFPIGDQFQKVTTGGISAALYSPATAYLSWNIGSSADTGMYVADGNGHWFRMSITNAPESGLMWSPIATIAGGTSAVQSIETTPGIEQLLLAPASSGPILFRDPTTNIDNTTNFAAPYATLGSIVMANSGEEAEVSHIALDSIKTGTAPMVSLLLSEISSTANAPFIPLDVTDYMDPPNLNPSQTLYSQRFSALQNGEPTLCHHLQLQINWTSENFPSELLSHTIYGAKHGERRSQ